MEPTAWHLSTAALVMGALGGMTSAHAGTVTSAGYAVATNQISNFGITTSGGVFVFAPTLASSHEFAMLGTVTASQSSPPINSDLDLAQACVGQTCPAQDDFVALSPPYTGLHARADTRVILGSTIVARDIAEVDVSFPPVSGSASAGNAVTTSFTVAGAGAKIGFTFDADLVMRVFGVGTSQTSFSITITDGNNATVFAWLPDGLPLGLFGGIEVSDPAALNQSITSGLFSASGHYAATSAVLSPGAYTLTVDMPETVSASAVPEPTTLRLLGIGVAGIWLGRRRRLCTSRTAADSPTSVRASA